MPKKKVSGTSGANERLGRFMAWQPSKCRQGDDGWECFGCIPMKIRIGVGHIFSAGHSEMLQEEGLPYFENLKEIKSREDLDFFVERLMDPVTKMFKEELAPESQDEVAPVGTNVQGGVGTKMSSQRCKQEEAAYMRHQSLKEKAKALTAAEAADIDMQVSLRIQRLKAEARAAEAAEFAATQGAPVKKVNLKQEPPPSPEASPLHMASPVSPVAKDVTLSPTAARAAAKRERRTRRTRTRRR